MATVTEFSVSNLPPEERARAWQKHVSHHWRGVEMRAKSDSQSHFDSRTIHFPRLFISHTTMSDQEIKGRPSEAVEQRGDFFSLVFPLRGLADVSQRNRSLIIRPGQVYFLHSQERYHNFLTREPITLVVNAPLSLLKQRVSWVEDSFAREHAADPDMVSLLTSYASSLVRFPVSDDLDGRLEATTLDLLTLMLESGRTSLGGERIPRSMRETLWTSLDLFIRCNHARMGLSAADAAAAFKVSERYIQQVMNEKGTTFRQAVIDHRLDEARRLLMLDGAGSSVQIGEIAIRCGFANQAHFSTRYRKRFGNSPRDERLGRELRAV